MWQLALGRPAWFGSRALHDVERVAHQRQPTRPGKSARQESGFTELTSELLGTHSVSDRFPQVQSATWAEKWFLQWTPESEIELVKPTSADSDTA